MIYDTITKTPPESFVIGVDFSGVLDRSETIVVGNSSYTITDTVFPTANDMVAQSDTLTTDVSNKLLLGRVSGGLEGREYIVKFFASTTANNIFEHDVKIKVTD